MTAPTVRPRIRAGSYDTFDRRYRPVMTPEDGIMRDWADPAIRAADERKVWTVVDCDGVLYLTPGFATVNYFARVLCEVPWSDAEFANPGYRY